MKTKIFLTVILFLAVAALVNAQVPGRGMAQTANTNNRTAWVDQDNNGVCDNFTDGNPRGQGKGNLAGKGKGSGNGAGKGKGNANGNGNGNCRGQGKNRGAGFVDADKDGVCDNFNANAGLR